MTLAADLETLLEGKQYAERNFLFIVNEMLYNDKFSSA